MAKYIIFYNFLLFGIVSLVIAQTAPEDTTHFILNASAKPFNSFVSTIIQVDSPPLPPPGDKLSDPKLSQVRDLIFFRISSVKLNINAAYKKELLETLTAMCSLRDWLLQHPVYSNITLTFKINETASCAVLAGLSNGSLTIEEAERLIDSLNKHPDIDTLLLAAEGGVPKSKAIIEFKQKANSETLLELYDKLAKEQGAEDIFSGDPENYLKQIDPSEFIFNAAALEDITYASEIWVKYVSEGGNLNLDEKDLKFDFDNKIPRIEELETPSGVKLDWNEMDSLIKDSRRWASTHSNP